MIKIILIITTFAKFSSIKAMDTLSYINQKDQEQKNNEQILTKDLRTKFSLQKNQNNMITINKTHNLEQLALNLISFQYELINFLIRNMDLNSNIKIEFSMNGFDIYYKNILIFQYIYELNEIINLLLMKKKVVDILYQNTILATFSLDNLKYVPINENEYIVQYSEKNLQNIYKFYLNIFKEIIINYKFYLDNGQFKDQKEKETYFNDYYQSISEINQLLNNTLQPFDCDKKKEFLNSYQKMVIYYGITIAEYKIHTFIDSIKHNINIFINNSHTTYCLLRDNNIIINHNPKFSPDDFLVKIIVTNDNILRTYRILCDNDNLEKIKNVIREKEYAHNPNGKIIIQKTCVIIQKDG